MAVVASFGDTVFSVSKNQIFSISNVARQHSARYAEHGRHLHKPLLEFLGPGLDSYSFDIELSVWLGVNPTREYQKLRRKMNDGKVERFVVGGAIQGSYKWVIEKMSNATYTYDKYGNVKRMKLAISLKEYPRR